MKLIVYKNKKDLSYIKNLLTKWIERDTFTFKFEIWKLHGLYTKINPPFFNEILVLRNDLTDNDFQMLFNMLNVGCKLIYLKSYNLNNFKNIITQNSYNYKDKLNVVTKNINYVFNFSGTKWRYAVDFIILGSQKCGTTALAYAISNHPDIYIDSNKDPRKSEIHFFDIYWTKGLDWYKRKFNYNKKIVGEKTPDLIYLDYTFPLIQMVNPYIKIILILRNPIHRAFSEYKMLINLYPDEDHKSFEEEINLELENINKNNTFFTTAKDYLQRGLYYKQIKVLLNWFPKDNILVLLTSDFEKNPLIECNKVYNFLNVKEQITVTSEKVFVAKDNIEIDNKLYKKLISFFKKDTEKLEKLLNIKTGWFS